MNPQKTNSLVSYWVAFVTLLFVTSEVLGGALRYMLTLAGLSELIYAPKILMALTILIIIVFSLIGSKMSVSLLVIIVVTVVFSVVGILTISNPLQVLFGIWVLVPLFFGIVVYPFLQKFWHRLPLPVFMFWLVAASGVFLNALIPLPWEGFEYEIGGVVVEGSRQWWSTGFARLAGFSRAFFAAADQTILLATLLLATVRGFQWGLRTIVWVVTGIVLVLTTTKTVVGVFIVLTFFFVLRTWLPQVVWRLAVLPIALVGIVLPVSTAVVNYRLNLDGGISLLLFRSFGIRLTEMWPNTLALITEHGNVFLGRGIGGIGAAQRFFEASLHSSADNLYLYLYVTFGALSLALVFMCLYSVRYLNLKENRLDILVYALLLSILLKGITSNLVESASAAISLGIVVRHLAMKHIQSAEPRASDKDTDERATGDLYVRNQAVG